MEKCKQILVAEDNADTRELVVRLLTAEGYKVQSARDGREALTFLNASTVQTLVLLDMMMPVLNGWEFLKLRKGSGHKIVSLSAINPDTLDDSALLDGVDAKLQKPFYAEDLLETVRTFCSFDGPLEGTCGRL